MIDIMKRMSLILSLVLCFVISCQDQPDPVQDQGVGTARTQTNGGSSGTTTTPPPVSVFDPSSISQEHRETTMTEIQALIQRLNGIIRAKNYNAWVSYLSPEYFAIISSPEYLENLSQNTVLARQNITLRSAQDYFLHVVVPSRTNDRVDDIEFISQNRVKAYTVNNRGERLRLYDLEKTGPNWKIIN